MPRGHTPKTKDELKAALGAELRRARLALPGHVTQRDVAVRLGLGPGRYKVVSHYERGAAMPDALTLFTLADVLGLDLSALGRIIVREAGRRAA